VIDTPKKSRRAIVAGLMALLLLASACGSNNDPKTWTEAGQDANVRTNFVTACQTANEGEKGMSTSQATTYCTRSFEALVDYYGGVITQPGDVLQDKDPVVDGRDFTAFLKLDSDLRKDPESIPADVSRMLADIATSVTS